MKAGSTPRGPISWMARNPVVANLLMISLLVSGFISILQIKKEVFPDIADDAVKVQVAYPGASPVEVERGILLAIEEQVRDLDGIKRVDAVANEGVGRLSLELKRGANKQKALMDVKNAVDSIRSFPLEAEEPKVAMADHKHGVMDLVIYGELSEIQLRALAESIRDRLLQLAGVSTVEVDGARPYEISVNVSQENLRRYGLTLSGIAAQIRKTAVEKAGGGIKADSGEVLLRMNERRDRGMDFRSIPIVYGANNQPILLGEIAKIVDGFSPDDERNARFNGKPAVVLSVFSAGNDSPADVAKTVRRFAEALEKELPSTVGIAFWNDRAQYFSGRLRLLLKNAAIGLVLVLIILGLLLEPKLAFWVAVGIPVSFMGSFFLLPAFGISLNVITMFAYMVTLGMVVDDAIVVGENVYHLRRRGISPIEASIRGAREMATPIVFSVLTTIAAFAPLLFVPGRIGKIQYAIPVILILVLMISLLESFFILPSHLARTQPLKESPIHRMQERISSGLERFINEIFNPLVTRAVRNRWITLTASAMILLVVAGLFTGGRVKYVDFPGGDRDEVKAEAVLPYGVDVSETEAVMQKLIDSARRTVEKMGGDKYSLGILSTIGVGRHDTKIGSNSTSVTVLLVPLNKRDFSSSSFAKAWQDELGPLMGLESLGFSATRHGLNKPIDFVISHSDIPTLEQIAKETAEQLARFAGVKEVNDGIADGKPQWDFTLTANGANAGLTVMEIGEQLRSAFYGAEALRQQRGRNEIKVMVRLPAQERESLQTVEELLLRTPDSGEIPLLDAAAISKRRAYKSIARTDGRRTLQITADVDDRVSNAKEIEQTLFSEVLPQLQQRYPGLEFGLRGRAEAFQGFRDFLAIGILMALIAIYGLVAVPLKSYLQPLLVVMAAIPFGFVGSVLAHFAMGMPISMFSLMGMLALGGVVVNDSIVFVTTANRYCKKGQPPAEAAVRAACRRFRPIMMTSLTTFFGLSPLILETSPEAQMMIPMAVSLSFGILVSTVFVLLLVPSLFVMVEHLRRKGEGHAAIELTLQGDER